MFVITLLLQYVCYFTMIQSALGFSFSFLSFLLREWNWQMTKMHLFGECTGAQMYFCYWNLVLKKKKYIERDCCVVNSCHLYVLNLCVSIFVVIVELAVIFCLKMDLIFQWSDYGCHINCCWFLKIVIKRCWENIALFIFNQFIDCVSLSVYFTNLSGYSLDYMIYPGYFKKLAQCQRANLLRFRSIFHESVLIQPMLWPRTYKGMILFVVVEYKM